MMQRECRDILFGIYSQQREAKKANETGIRVL